MQGMGRFKLGTNVITLQVFERVLFDEIICVSLVRGKNPPYTCEVPSESCY